MTAFFTNDKDRKVKVFNNGVAVSSSNAQSEYSRYLNFKENFTISTNTISGNKVYDIVGKGYAIPQEGGTPKGTTNRPLNFNDSHFDITETTGSPGSYDISSTGWAKVNSFTVKPLNIINATNNEAVTAAEGASTINLTFNNDETDVYSNGTKVTAAPRSPNFSTDFTVTDDSANDRVNIGLASGFLPNPLTGKKFGLMYGAQNTSSPSDVVAGMGLLNIPYTTVGGGNTISGGYDATHGVYRRYTLGSDDNDAFKILSGADITNRSANPHIYGKMRIATLQDNRHFLGFNTGTIPDNDDNFLDNLQGFGIGYQYDTGGGSPNTTWQILRNDGDATTDKVSTGITIAASTVFTFELVGDATNSRWGWNVNGGAFTYYTTEVPTTSNLRFTYQLEEIGTTEAEIDIFYLFWTQDK